MNHSKNIENIIKSKKWIKNDMGAQKFQYSKLLEIDEELALFIVSNTLEGPIYSRVENLLIVNDELNLFYNNEFSEVLDREEYEDYSDYLSKAEWRALFDNDPCEKLDENGMASKKEKYYLQSQNNIESIMESGYDEDVTETVREYFNL